LNMGVVAEGIQTRDQLEFLRDRQCPEGQGFYFGPPVPAAELTELWSGAVERPLLPMRSQSRAQAGPVTRKTR
jgi:EAL domain-containing protein (putative c-di-GMP-specific phosphodiesterase class I)